jgi:small subunit ribosomal protein S9
MKNQQIITSGKRKRAIAKALIKPGTGNVTINGIPYENLSFFHKLIISEPIQIAKEILSGFNYDIKVRVTGGGNEGQIEAARLAIGRAICKINKSSEIKKAMLSYDRNMLVADTRRKEPYKPGDSKARAKRQKSYR